MVFLLGNADNIAVDSSGIVHHEIGKYRSPTLGAHSVDVYSACAAALVSTLQPEQKSYGTVIRSY